MTYVVTESCIKCKYTDCVEAIEAIKADDELPPDQIEFIEINLKLAEVYENITEAKDPLPEAEKYKDIKNKKQFL